MKKKSVLLATIMLTVSVLTLSSQPGFPAESPNTAMDVAAHSGELLVAGQSDAVERMPLLHTDVQAAIVGHVATVKVTQEFGNPFDRKIEAIYVFPLPNRAAVDEMTIELGDRIITGLIKKREEARNIYKSAKQAGHVAALLDQERPNIFTQSVANIMPGNRVRVTIRFFETLPYASGVYEFVFPMVVGPRFIPGSPTTAGDHGRLPNSTAVHDASRISPPVSLPGHRSGNDISLTLRLDGGTSVYDLTSPSHAIEVRSDGMGADLVKLQSDDMIPNKDFVLRYRLDGLKPNFVLLPHRENGVGYFLGLIQPEHQPAEQRIAPKEMIFVVDCSGSMSGFPIARVRAAMAYALERLNPLDTFQIIRFSTSAVSFARAPLLATSGNIERALRYVERLSGNGGTIMLEGVKAAVDFPEDPDRLRIVSFMTDGYIGNEEQILSYLRAHLGKARLFSIGVGSSVNRHLLDEMARFGRGAVDYILINEATNDAVARFYERIRSPYLTEIAIDWGDVPVKDIYPRQIPDLFLGQPIVLYGRYEGSSEAEITLRGRLGGRPYEQRVIASFPGKKDLGEAIGALWARARIADLSSSLVGGHRHDIVEEITNIALKHHLVSKYTSFVAVEWTATTGDLPAEMIEIPAELPEGVSPFAVQNDLSTFSSEFIASLPILGRNYQDVLTPAPGVTDSDGDGQPNVHGARDTDVNTIVDNVSTVDPVTGEVGEQLDVESIREIDVKTTGASAEFSRGQGGFVNVSTGSGGSSGGSVGGVGGGNLVEESEKISAEFSPESTGLACRLEIESLDIHADDPIVITLTIENTGQENALIPARLSILDGTARFLLVGPDSSRLPQPRYRADELSRRVLAAGEKATFRILLNKSGGYAFERPGRYLVRFLGDALGLPDSNEVTIVLEP